MILTKHRFLFLAVLLLGGPAAVADALFPPIADPPTDQHLRGKLVWADLVTADLDGSRRFYGGLFDWTFVEISDAGGDYVVAYGDGVPVAGMVSREPLAGQRRQARWIAYMSVSDVAAAAQDVVNKGGEILISARSVPARGEMAVLADPDGVPFGLIDSSSGDPEDFLPEIGDWIWAVYQSPDVNSAAAFYQDLAGYDVVPRGQLGKALHYLFVADGYARASIVEIPVDRLEMRPDWLYFVRVGNIEEALDRVNELGGRTLARPRSDVVGGQLAVIADPAGAPLGLMHWPEPDESGN